MSEFVCECEDEKRGCADTMYVDVHVDEVMSGLKTTVVKEGEAAGQKVCRSKGLKD